MGFKDLVQLIQDGEAVTAGVANRVPSAAFNNTEYLRQVFEESLFGSAVIARSVAVDPDLVVGTPVYFSTVNQRFEAALASTDTDPDTGMLITAAKSQVWGVVYRKEASTSLAADIMMGGYGPVDISGATEDGTVKAGQYFLSGTNSGKLTPTRPPAGVAVLQADGLGNVNVTPRIFDLLEGHRHERVELLTAPAGSHTPPSMGEKHEITAPDISAEGWLPADDAIFDGKAPSNAAFGYNLSAASWGGLWPPIPLTNVSIEFDKGEDKDTGATLVPLGPEGLIEVDENGIWWLSDCYEDVPWHPQLTIDDYSEWSEGVEDSEGIECPRNLYRKMFLYFTRMSFQTSGTVVTSLITPSTSRLTITCADTGEPATSGHLQIDLDLELVSGTTDNAGHVVLKTLEDNTFNAGPVVEAVKAGTANVTVSSTAQSGANHQGIVTISVDTELDGKELPISVVRLAGAEEGHYQNTLSVLFPQGRASSYRGRIYVPSSNVLEDSEMQLQFWLMGLEAGTLPQLSLTYRRVPKPDPIAALPTTDTALTIDTTEAISADNYVLVANTTPFTVQPGDIIYFTFSRGSDVYASDVHVLHQGAVLTSPSS